jgi:hypothetical protein
MDSVYRDYPNFGTESKYRVVNAARNDDLILAAKCPLRQSR